MIPDRILFRLGRVCIPNPCTNGGTCEPRPNGVFQCTCPPEYEGQRCEFRKYFFIERNTSLPSGCFHLWRIQAKFVNLIHVRMVEHAVHMVSTPTLVTVLSVILVEIVKHVSN